MQTLWGIQYLRAAAALSVLFFHAAIGAGGHNALGTGGVDIFFVISGFLMFELAAREPPARRFAWARIQRIVPTYWLVTFIVAVIEAAGVTNKELNVPHLIKSLLFIPDLDPVRLKAYPTLIVGWTLNYEMFFYAIVTLLLFVREPLRIFALGGIFAALLATNLLIGGQYLIVDFYTDPIILEFFCGALLSVAWRAGAMPHSGWPLILIGTVLLIAPQPAGLLRVVGYGMPATLIVLGVLAAEARRPVPRVPFLRLLGDASYSIYLWHLFFVTLCFRIMGESPLSFATAVFGGTALGVVSYWIIEKPSLALFRRADAMPAA